MNAKERNEHNRQFHRVGMCPYAVQLDCENCRHGGCTGSAEEFERCFKVRLTEKVVFT